MSVSIGWRPNNPNQLIFINGGSSFHKVLEDAFGNFPITLDSKNTERLRGIAACGYTGAEELIDALYEKDSIIVEAEW